MEMVRTGAGGKVEVITKVWTMLETVTTVEKTVTVAWWVPFQYMRARRKRM